MIDCNERTWEGLAKGGRLYAIADAQALRQRDVGLREFAEGLRARNVGIVQWRAKNSTAREILAGAAVLREVFPSGSGCRLIMNDRADLALIAGFDGAHIGQEDLGVEEVRRVLNKGQAFATNPERSLYNPAGERRAVMMGEFVVGVSTHTEEQVITADLSTATYVAVGPVFTTGTKADAAAVVGIEGLRRARKLTKKPLVAIGGITWGNALSVIDAGADSIAMINALLAHDQ